ncbi:hypothetical protein RJ640_024291 [Escallonia rubra]|uniref:Uncharacterized protein n=1 Tax=Escallonia rubra TaxID=112253 RepID=A0AA88RM98_9ASTE|nr:hypothetical protein RJ640_024291 [Escallonia rubra]
MQSLTPLMVRSLVRFVISLVGDPAASVTTILYYSDLLPQNYLLMRHVRPELLGQENYLFNFLINLLSSIICTGLSDELQSKITRMKLLQCEG